MSTPQGEKQIWKFMQNIYSADTSTLKETYKYAKILPLGKLLAERFGRDFQLKKSLSHNEVMTEYFGRYG